MLSILIPTYNYDCTQLVKTLLQQLPKEAEILVGDDKSTDQKIVEQLDALGRVPNVRLIRPSSNMGRAGIRNMLCKEAYGDCLLYIDSDAIVEDEHFIEKYLSEKDGGVVRGFICHPDLLPSPQQSLRWKYEKQYERRMVMSQTNSPYQHFRTSHFLIPRHIMQKVPFDEQITRSGYEDLLFGKQLEEIGISMKVADIYVTNGDIETNEVYLKKTEEHMHTLLQLQTELKGYSTLLYIYARIEKLNLLWLLKGIYRCTKPLIRRNLLSGSPSIRLFQMYKLGYFALLKDNG